MALLRILYAFGSVAGLGIVLGVGLAIANRLLALRKDERAEAVERILPGVNCGACGFAGCAAYAGAVVGGEAALDLCTVGGAQVARQIAEIMGQQYSGGAVFGGGGQCGDCGGKCGTKGAGVGGFKGRRAGCFCGCGCG